MAEQKKRTSEGLYSALQQISDEEGVDFGLSGMSADDFKKKYFTGPGNIENLYHRLDKISREEGIDFGQGSGDEWLSSFGYKRNPNGGRGYMTLDGKAVGGGKPKALKPHSQQRPAGGGAFGLPEGTTYSDEVVRRHNSPSNVAGDYKDWSKIASEVESEGLPAYRHGTKEPVRRDASSYGAPYKPDTQLTAAQRDEIHRQNDFAVRQMRQLEKRTREEQRRRNQPIVDTGDEGANRHVIKTQGQWEDELQGGVSELGKKYVTPLVGKAMKQAEDAWFESMRESSSAPMGEGMELHALRRANEAADPDKILQGLQQSLEQAYNNPQMQADIEKRANAAGIPKEDYISKVVVPSLRQQMESEFASSQIARNMPRNAVEYVLQGLGNSVGGMLMSAATETRSQRAYKNQAAAMTEEGQNPYYQPGTGARLTQMGVTFAADAPFFGLYGKVGGSVAKHVAEREIKKLMAKGLSEGAARSVVGTALENSVGARMKNYLMQHVVSSSITMGGFNMTSEAARQVRDSEFAPGQILTSGLEGAATGAAFGVTGGAVQAVSQPLRGIARIGSKAGGFLAEAETMYATEELAKMVHGEEGFSNPFEGSVEALMKLGVMKASSGHPLMKAVETGASIRKNGLRKTAAAALSPKQSGMRFTEDEEAYVRNSTEGKNLLDSLSRLHPEVAVSEAGGKSKLTPEGERLRQQLARNYSDFMCNQDIPYSVKMKVARALGGLMPDAAHTPLETGADIIHNADGSVILKTRDRDGNCMQDLKFDSFSDAEAWREAHEGQFRLNDAVNMWNESGAETRSKMLRELMEENGVDVRQAREMIDATLDGALGTSFDNEQFLSIYDTIHRNAYPADEAHTRRNYWEGMKLTPGERHQAMMEAQRAEERLEYMDGEFADEVKGAADYADEKIAELAGRDEITGEQLEAAIDYYNKVAKANGMMEEALNSVDSQVEAANAFIRRNTHTGSGQLIECAKGERGYYVTAGNLKLNPDGGIDMESSGDVVILRDKSTGEIEVVNPRDVKVTAISDPRRMMAENDSMDGLRGRLMKEADDNITLNPETPKEPQNGDMFLGEDGMRWMTMQADDGTGNPVWVKMALDEQMQPVGEPLPLDVDEWRRAKSIEIDEQSMPREEHTTADAATEEMPAEETPAEAAVPEKSRVTGAGGGETPTVNQPHSEVDVPDEGGKGNQDAPLPPVGQMASRIPVDRKGRPQYEQATPEDTMAELTEKYGEEKAGRMLATMAENTRRALEELQQKDTSKMTDMADLAAHEDALADAERKAAYWQQFMKKEEPKAEEPTTEQPRIEETKVDEPAIEQPEQHQEPQTPVQPQQPQPPAQPAQPAPPQPQQPNGQEKIYRGSTEANVGRTFTFTNSAGVRSELTIERVDGEGNAVVSRRDFDLQGNPTGEAREESYAAARVGEAIVDGTWKQVKSVEDRLREAYKGRLGMQNVIDVLTEAEKERMLDATERGDDEALREMQNEFVETHRGDIILKTRDKRNQSVSGILSGGFSIGEKLRRIRKQFQGYDDAEIMLSDEALQPSTLEEYVADLHRSVPKKGEGPIAYFSYGEGNARVIGMQDETGHGTKTGGDTKGYAPWLAPKGKGMSLQKYAETIHEQLPEGIKEQYSDQDVRNAILEVFGGAERPSDIPTMIIRRGVLQAEQAARRMEEMWIDGVSYQKKPKSFAERLQRGIEQTSQEPTDAQKEAGNYAKGHVTFGGYHFTIENPAGSVRRGTDADGHQWEQQMHHTYGYILGRYGKDGDHLDMFINDKADLDEWNGRVYVVDQVDPKTGRFDEHKILYGFDSLDEARRAYLSNYEDGWQGLGRITGVSKEKFDEWVDSSKRKMKPFAEHSIGREAAVEDVRERIRQEQQREQEAAAREQVLLDAAIEHLQKHGMEVISDEEGQRVIDRFNGRLTDDVKQMGTTTKKRQESLTASFEGRELSTEQQVVVDAFTGRISNGVLTVKDRKGKTRNITLKQGEDRKAGVKHSLFRHYGTNENFYNADEILFIPDVIANGVRSQAKSKVAYKLEKDGVTYTVTTLLKSNGKEIFTNFYTDREPIAGINGKSNTAMQHLPQQSDSGAKVQQNPDTTKDSGEKQPKFFKTPDGEAYGFTYQGRMYIDKRIANVETPVHEYGHLWVTMKRTAAPEEWTDMKRVLLGDKLIKPILDKVRDEYPELTTGGKEDDFMEEVLTQFSGRRGAERLREVAEQVARENGGIFGKAEAVTAMQRLKNVLNRFWESVARMLGVKYRNANDIADMMMKDFLNGVDPREGGKPVGKAGDRKDMRVYHGSSAEFEQFDHSKVGSGEGQAVSGYGTYVTTSEGTARYYAEVSSERHKNVIQNEGWTLNGEIVRDSSLKRAYDFLKEYSGNVDEAMAACEAKIEARKQRKDAFSKLFNNTAYLDRALDYLRQEKEKPGTLGYQERIEEKPDRQLYEVEIPDDTGSNYLDLDAKLTKKQKAEIKKRFFDAINHGEEAAYWRRNRDIINDEWRAVDSEEGTGDMERGVMEQFIPQSDVSKIFSDMGYVGSKTRGSDGTTYIVYNEKDLKIKDRMMVQKKSASEPFRLSAEQKDAEGNSFYERKGSVDLWNISPLFTKARRQDAPIRLTERNANHIMSSHGNVFKSEQDVFDFLDGVFSNATKLRRGRGRGMFVVVEDDKTDQAAIIKLMPSESGDYYNVETAGYYRKSKWKNSEEVIADLSEPGQSDAAADASKPQIPDENGREPINTEAQVPSSAGKDTNNSPNFQENGGENADGGLKFQKVSHPEPEMTPEGRLYWKQWDAAMKKWKERNGIGADETGPGEKPQFQPGEMALDFAKRLMRHKRQEALWRTAPQLKDYQQVRDDKDSQELAREQEKAYPDSQWARMQRVAADMARLRHSMKRQKEYDKATVKAVTDFAHDFMAMGFGEELGRNDVKRILSSVKNATGARDIRKHLDNVMNILTDNYLRNLKAQLDKLASVKDLRQTVQGVDRQGKLDIKGQKMIQEFRKAMGAELASGVDNITRSADEVEGKVKSLRDRLSVISENMEKGDAAMWEEEYEGVSLALQYFDNIARSQANVTSYREQREDAVKLYKQSGRSYEAQQQLLEAIDQAIFDESVERIGMYGDLLARLQGKVSESMEGAKAFREKKKERLKLIHTLAARDMEGIDADTTHEETWKSRLNNSSVPRLFLGSAATFEQMLRLIGGKNANGEGWTYNHMMRGYIGSVDNEQKGREEAYRELDAKVSELFGRKMRFSDLYAVDRDTKNFPPATVEWLTADGEKKKHTLSQAQLLNIYMWDKQVQGAVKLRAQGIDEAAVERIKKALDPRLLQLADWLQGDFLARRREKYSKVYERVFGAAMPAVENYFPLRVDGDAITRDIDVTADPASDNVLPSNVTGSIIRRTANSKPLDILNTDAISLVIEHIDNMEKWSAFVEWYEDINALLSYSRFRNQVKNMGNTLYGSGEKLWENFRKTAQIAAGTYRPSRSEADKAITTIASGVTGAKIAFRPFTALKQLLSAPAFMTDASAKYFTYSFVNQKNFWHDNVKWAKENMPVLRKRWTSRDLGDTRLTDKTGWGYWDTKVRGFMAQYGMWMNGGIDLLTCAAGARAIYRTRYDRYVRQGFDKDTAHKRALQDAEIGYNLTQQSSEGAFVSAIQKDRTLFANAYSVFRNSSMSYTRQTVTAIRNIRNLAASKKEMIETMERQLKADGLSEADAGKAARWEYKRAWWRNGVRLAVSAWVLPLFWELGSKVPYLFLGDDDDTKKKMLEDVLKKELVVGPVEGFVGGQTYNALWGAASSEDLPGIYREQGLRAVFKEGFKAMERQDASPLPLFADMGRTLHKFTYDETAGLQDMVNLAVQMVTGFNPQTLTDPIVAAIDWSRGDMDSAKEIEVFLLRVLMVPQESAKNVYIDELGMTADKAKALGYDELAERYARYMVQKGAPMTGWMYSDADEKKRMDSHVKRFSDDVTRRMEQLDQKEMLGIWNSSGSIEEKRLMGKVLAARAMSRDTDGEKPKYDWQRTYQEVRTLDDVDKGLLLFKLKQELGADKESNAKVLKAIEKKQKKMTETKKKLHDGKLTAEEAQKRIRKLRNEAIELAVKAGATGR